jgi:hypothetical protein
MKGIKAFFVLPFAAAAMVWGAYAFTPASFAAAAQKATKPEDVFTFKDGAWRVKSGGKTKEFEGVSGTGKRKAGPVPWCVVNPDTQEEAKGLKAGVLLYFEYMAKRNRSPYAFLRLNEDAVRVGNVEFAPVEGVAVISRSGRFAELLSLYSLSPYFESGGEKPLKSYKSFLTRNDAVFWAATQEDLSELGLVGPDVACLAFTLVDEEVERPEVAGMFGATAAFFCPPGEGGEKRVNDGLLILKKATKTENFEAGGVSGDGKKLSLTMTSVKSEKDWKLPDKWREWKIEVKLPLAPVAAKPEIETIAMKRRLKPGADELTFALEAYTMGKSFYTRTITVKDAGGKTIQKIKTADFNDGDDAYSDKSDPNKRLIFEDLNFDGWDDLRTPAFLPVRPNIPYIVWLWDAGKKRFVHDEALSALDNIEADRGAKTIKSSGADSSVEYMEKNYKYIDGRLTLVKSVTRTYLRDEPGMVEEVTLELKNGEMAVAGRVKKKAGK